MRTPTTILLIFPPPPPILMPPSIAPAMTVNSEPMPRPWFMAPPLTPMLTIWATPKKKPARAKIRIRIFATDTPDRATASGLEPNA